MARSLTTLAFALLAAPVALAQGQATVLNPISPIEVEPMNKRPVIAADAGGNVMVVFWGKQGDERVLWSLRSSGGAWSDAEVPLPAGEDRWFSFDLYDLAGRNGQFALLLKERGHEHYAEWSGGSWSTPVEFPDDIDHPRELGFDASGNLIAWDPGSHSHVSRLTGGTWQTIELPQRHETHGSCPPNRLLLGRTGALHLLGETQRDVLMVGSCPAGSDPMQPASWVYQPDGYNPDHTGGARSKREVGYALDWPRQTLWMGWEGTGTENRDKVLVSHAPIGTTSEAGWTTWQIQVPEGQVMVQRIVSSGAGAVGIAYQFLVDHEDELYFRWLPQTGLGQELGIVRPGSQTEAATFSQLYHGALEVAAAPDGTAHVVIKGKKRGEYPENAERIYYSRITGGAVLDSEPGVQGGGTQIASDGDDDAQPDQPDPSEEDWQQQGGKPDLQPIVTLDDDDAYQRDGQTVYRYRQSFGIVQPEVAVRNLASQYFGDLEVDVLIDGVVVHYVNHDESEHMRAMIERDDELDITLRMPRLKYESRPQDGWQPPVLELADTDRGGLVRMHAPLGRKTIRVVVDPNDRIDEVNEDNNVAELEYEVSCAREDEDRLRLDSLAGGPLTVGYNDLALRDCTLAANTPIAAPGLIQAPTTLRMIVGNPRGASFFGDVPVAVLIDGEEIVRRTIPLIDGEYRLHNAEVEAFGWQGGEERRGPDIRGGFMEVPVDLTSVDVGSHTLTVTVDPEDAFADLQRDNNSITVPLRVRERGGTLQVQVRDADTRQGASLAHVLLRDLFFSRTDRAGHLTIPDVPAGSYEPRDLWCDRPYPEPRYAGRPADSEFTVRNGQTTLVTASLEQPVDVFLQVTDAETGEALDAPATAQLTWAGTTPWGSSDSGEIVGWRQGASQLVFPDCRPGACTVAANAYAYEPATLQADVHRDARGESHLQMSLQRSARGSVQVTVTDEDGDAVRGAWVSLQNAPRGAATDDDGVATIAEVEAGRAYTAVVSAEDYTSGSTSTGTVAAGQTLQCAIQVATINQRERTIDFDGIAWAQCESWPGFSFGPIGSEGYEVSAEHGRFHATLAVKYHEIAGTDRAVVDEVIAAFEGAHFWRENVTYEYSLADIIGAGLKKVAGKRIGQLVKLAGPINDVYDWLNGDVDPNRLGDGEVVGTYTSWTGTEYQSETLIPIPSIPFSPGMSGGQTVVRTDILEVTDGTRTHTVRRQWYSPSMMVYRVGEEMDIDSLEVRLFLRVLNERLSPGPLYANSRNVIHWKPSEGEGEDAWVDFHPVAYDALGLQ